MGRYNMRAAAIAVGNAVLCLALAAPLPAGRQDAVTLGSAHISSLEAALKPTQQPASKASQPKAADHRSPTQAKTAPTSSHAKPVTQPGAQAAIIRGGNSGILKSVEHLLPGIKPQAHSTWKGEAIAYAKMKKISRQAPPPHEEMLGEGKQTRQFHLPVGTKIPKLMPAHKISEKLVKDQQVGFEDLSTWAGDNPIIQA